MLVPCPTAQKIKLHVIVLCGLIDNHLASRLFNTQFTDECVFFPLKKHVWFFPCRFWPAVAYLPITWWFSYHVMNLDMRAEICNDHLMNLCLNSPRILGLAFIYLFTEIHISPLQMVQDGLQWNNFSLKPKINFKNTKFLPSSLRPCHSDPFKNLGKQAGLTAPPEAF